MQPGKHGSESNGQSKKGKHLQQKIKPLPQLVRHNPTSSGKGDNFFQVHHHHHQKLSVGITVMHAAHQAMGKRWSGSRKGIYQMVTAEAVADTGCQTCIAGQDILEQIKCPESYMIPTSHRIVGITDDSVGIVGAVLLRIAVGEKSTRQMVYISNNIDGLFLSRTALEDLGVIRKSFPSADAKGSRAFECKSEGVDTTQCSCPSRTATPHHPDSIPFNATPENVPRLKEWLLSEFAASAFNTCSQQPLQEMTGTAMKVTFKDGHTPSAVHTPIPVPHHWKRRVKEDIDRDVRLGIIEPVPQGTTTTWCSRMIITPKKDGSPRRTVDLQKLNAATERETHHTPSPFNLVSAVPKGKRKTVLDAWNGYHSLPLEPSSKDATTFITEWGRYRYCRAPMGFHASGDAYTRRFDDITTGQQRVTRCVDDTLLWDADIEEAFWHTFDYVKL